MSFFVFSSRRRHTRYWRDWSSDVCSSDLYRKYPRTSGSGIPQVKGIILGTVHYKHWFEQLIAKFVGGLFGIGAGLSLGREGPSVQLGSYVASGIAKSFHCNQIGRASCRERV